MTATISPDKKLIVSGDYETIIVWDGLTGEPIWSLTGLDGPTRCLKISPDGKKVACGFAYNSYTGYDKDIEDICAIIILDSVEKDLWHVLKGHVSDVRDFAFVDNGAALLSCSEDKTIKLWDLDDGELIKTFYGHTDGVEHISVSPDGRHFATSSFDNTLRLWEMPFNRWLKSFDDHSSDVFYASYSPDGKRIVSASKDGEIRIFDAETGKCQNLLEGHENETISTMFSPDGNMIVSTSLVSR